MKHQNVARVTAIVALAALSAAAQTLPFQGTTTSSNVDLSAFKVVNNTNTAGTTTAFRAEGSNASGTATGLYAAGNYGVYATATTGYGVGVYSNCSSTGTGLCFGVWAETTAGSGDGGVAGQFRSDIGTGVLAWSSKGRAVSASADNSGSFAVYASSIAGTALKVTSVSGSASQFESQSGLYPAIMVSNSGAAPVISASSSSLSSGDAVLAVSTTGDGVEAKCTNSNCQNGVYGFSGNSGASCVIGQSSASVQGYGVVGRSYGTGKGVYGDLVSGSAGGYAGYFNGPTHVNGALSKLSGSFKIDHPQDPANKFLVHSFVESPDMKNVYDGIVTLGSNGTATVVLPSYFESLNSDFRYQLTPIGSAANLFIKSEVLNGMFEIAGGAPGQRVSWQVTGIRKDAWAKAHPIVPEQLKAAGERGKYLTPEFISGAAEPIVAQPADPTTGR